MKTFLVKMGLVGLVGSASLAAPALAGDWNNGAGPLPGMRGTAVPVPAPAPVPDYRAKWYFRGDVGINVRQTPKTSENGMRYGHNDSPGTTGPEPFNFGGVPFFGEKTNNDFPASGIFGVGVGYYWSPNVRFDLTADVRSSGDVKMSGDYQYFAHRFGVPTINDYSRDGTTLVSGNVYDHTRMRSGIFLANAYYDIGRYDRFRPYIGAGIGFSFNELERSHRRVETSCNPNPPDRCSIVSSRINERTTSKDHSVTLAAALTAGFSYEVYRGTHLDFNYRYLYTGATHADLSFGGDQSRVEIADTHDHNFRAGIRWDIN